MECFLQLQHKSGAYMARPEIQPLGAMAPLRLLLRHHAYRKTQISNNIWEEINIWSHLDQKIQRRKDRQATTTARRRLRQQPMAGLQQNVAVCGALDPTRGRRSWRFPSSAAITVKATTRKA
jgi:hypothetical protein